MYSPLFCLISPIWYLSGPILVPIESPYATYY